MMVADGAHYRYESTDILSVQFLDVEYDDDANSLVIPVHGDSPWDYIRGLPMDGTQLRRLQVCSEFLLGGEDTPGAAYFIRVGGVVGPAESEGSRQRVTLDTITIPPEARTRLVPQAQRVLEEVADENVKSDLGEPLGAAYYHAARYLGRAVADEDSVYRLILRLGRSPSEHRGVGFVVTQSAQQWFADTGVQIVWDHLLFEVNEDDLIDHADSDAGGWRVNNAIGWVRRSPYAGGEGSKWRAISLGRVCTCMGRPIGGEKEETELVKCRIHGEIGSGACWDNFRTEVMEGFVEGGSSLAEATPPGEAGNWALVSFADDVVGRIEEHVPDDGPPGFAMFAYSGSCSCGSVPELCPVCDWSVTQGVKLAVGFEETDVSDNMRRAFLVRSLAELAERHHPTILHMATHMAREAVRWHGTAADVVCRSPVPFDGLRLAGNYRHLAKSLNKFKAMADRIGEAAQSRKDKEAMNLTPGVQTVPAPLPEQDIADIQAAEEEVAEYRRRRRACLKRIRQASGADLDREVDYYQTTLLPSLAASMERLAKLWLKHMDASQADALAAEFEETLASVSVSEQTPGAARLERDLRLAEAVMRRESPSPAADGIGKLRLSVEAFAGLLKVETPEIDLLEVCVPLWEKLRRLFDEGAPSRKKKED